MSKSDTGGNSSKGKMTLIAFAILALCGIGLRGKSTLMERGARAAKSSKAIQGQPIESSPKALTPQKRDLPANADLEAMKASAPAPEAKEGYLSLNFDELSGYEFPVNLDGTIGALADGKAPTIPDDMKKLDQKKVVISGYMMPLNFDQSKVTYFILNKNQLMCCYGEEPKINEYCVVVLKKPADLHMDLPVTVSGTLQVGELMEGNTILCVYRLSGESVEAMN